MPLLYFILIIYACESSKSLELNNINDINKVIVKSLETFPIDKQEAKDLLNKINTRYNSTLYKDYNKSTYYMLKYTQAFWKNQGYINQAEYLKHNELGE